MKKVLKFKVIGVLAAVSLLLLAATVAYAGGGHTSGQLENAGWDCMGIPPNNWQHCFPPNSFPPAPGPSGNLPATIQVKVFGEEGYPFLGTELLIRYDLYERGEGKPQPCPQDGGGPYHDLRPELPYYACHHFDTSH